MSRAVLRKTNILIAAIVAIVGISGGAALVVHNRSGGTQLVTNAQKQLTEISYHGRSGVDALTLLKQHATVVTKQYSFGDLVVSIDGSQGSGPKYWTLYVNGKMAQTGASAYKTTDSDVLTWKLQQL